MNTRLTVTDPTMLRWYGWRDPLPSYVSATPELWREWSHREAARTGTKRKRTGGTKVPQHAGQTAFSTPSTVDAPVGGKGNTVSELAGGEGGVRTHDTPVSKRITV